MRARYVPLTNLFAFHTGFWKTYMFDNCGSAKMKALFKRIARKLGYEVTRIGKSTDPFEIQRRLVSQPNPVIFDVGAHVGETAKRYRLIFPDATIYCFEPFPPSFARLFHSLSEDKRVEIHQVALSETSGTGRLTINKSDATNSLLSTDQRAVQYWGPGLLDTQDVMEVAIQTVDAFCHQRRIDRINILKLDVQGSEYSVLLGAQKMLSNHAIDIVYMEMITAPTYIGQRNLHEYLALFESHNYVPFDFYNPVRKNGFLIQTDNIIISPHFLKTQLVTGGN